MKNEVKITLKRKFRKLNQKRRLLRDIKKVLAALSLCGNDFEKVGEILTITWGEEKAGKLIKRYFDFIGAEPGHQDNYRNFVTSIVNLII